jgi:hypothetical protein
VTDVGVVFPAGPDGRRSTAALGRAVVADALRPVDPAGAGAAERETNWRAGYLPHFRRLVEAGLVSREAALTIADAGLASLHRRMRVAGPDGAETALGDLVGVPADRVLATEEVTGTAEPEGSCRCPSAASGCAATRCCAGWTPGSRAGSWSPRPPRRCAPSSRTRSGWRLPDTTVVVLGAGAEMGPLTALLRWGARVAGVDLPRPAAVGAGARHRPPRRGHAAVPGAGATPGRGPT